MRRSLTFPSLYTDGPASIAWNCIMHGGVAPNGHQVIKVVLQTQVSYPLLRLYWEQVVLMDDHFVTSMPFSLKYLTAPGWNGMAALAIV